MKWFFTAAFFLVLGFGLGRWDSKRVAPSVTAVPSEATSLTTVYRAWQGNY